MGEKPNKRTARELWTHSYEMLHATDLEQFGPFMPSPIWKRIFVHGRTYWSWAFEAYRNLS